MKILLPGPFAGELPRMSAELLPANAAQTAQNTKLYSGEIRPFRALRRVTQPLNDGVIEAIYRFGATAGADGYGIVTGVSTANPAVIESEDHGLSTGDSVFISGVNAGTHQVNDAMYEVTVVDPDNFSIGVSGSGWDAVTSSGTWVKKNGHWMSWAADVDVARGPVAGDTLERTYFTGDGVPKMTYTPFAETSKAYIIVNVGGNKTGASSTGLSNDATVYRATVGIQSSVGSFTAQNVDMVGSTVQTFALLIAALQAGLTDSSIFPGGLTIGMADGNLKFTQNSVVEDDYLVTPYNGVNIVIDSDSGTNPVFTSLNGYLEIEGTPIAIGYIRGVDATVQGEAYPVDSFTLGLPAPDVDDASTNAVVASNTANITAASKANPVRVVYSSSLEFDQHQFQVGDEVTFASIVGMTDLNGNRYRVGAAGWLGYHYIDLYTLSGDSLDGTGFGTYTSGGTVTESYANVAEQDRETRSYVFTYVTEIGEEGPPSDPLSSLEWKPGKVVSISNIPGTPVGDYNIVSVRIYRTASGADGAEFLFVDEIDIDTTSYTDYVKGDFLGEVLPSALWDAPPEDMTGLIALPNEGMAGISGNVLCFSYPGQPHAWPATYQKASDYPLVGLGNIGTTVVAVAENDAYVANGADPANTNLEALKLNQGGVSKRGIVTLGVFGVVYPSADGLVIVRQGGLDIVTKDYFSRDEWQELDPSSIHAYALDSRYVAFYDNGTTQGGFIFDPAQADAGLIFIDVYATAGRYDPKSDLLHLMVDDYIEQWDSNTLNNLTYLWESKKFDTVELVSFTCAEVRASDYSDLTFRLYVDDVQVHEQAVTSQEPFRLNDYEPGRQCEIEVEGKSPVKRIVIAESFEELA